MSRESLTFVFGIVVIIAPHLGIPEAWKVYLFTVLGALLMFIGYSLRRSSYLRSIEHNEDERRADSFVEHRQHPS